MKIKNMLKVKAVIISTTMLLLAVSFLPSPLHAQSKAGQVVSSGEAPSRKGTVKAVPVQGSLSTTLPGGPPPGGPRGGEHPRLDPPVDPSVRPEDIRPTNSETKVRIVSDPPPNGPAGGRAAPNAPETFTFYRNTPLASAPCPGTGTCAGGAMPLSAYIPIEPSGAANGRVVFYTTNSYAAVSGDGGQTFSFLNPFTTFAASNGGFGGDQVVYYDRAHGLLFWLLQYNADNNSSTQRLAVARSQADILNNSWVTYDFTPATYGFTTPPAGATGFWLDFPDLAVSDNFLYITTNVFPRITANAMNPCAGTCPTTPCPATCMSPTGCTSICNTRGAVIARLPMNQLMAGQNLSFRFYSDTNSGYRATHGAHGTIYWGSHNTNTQIRIYRWDENSDNVARDDVNHDAFNTGTMTANGPDGSNFAAIADSRILGAYVANGVIGFMWNAAQGGGFAYPNVQWLRFKESDRSRLSQWQVFNANHAFLYPSVHPNDRGHVGGTLAWGGGTFFPSALAWVKDDFNPAETFTFDNSTFATGTAGPCDPNFAPAGGGCYNRWGDYFSTRVDVPYGNSWVGTGFVLTGMNGVTRDPRFVWFGRERDTPPQRNTIFVGSGATSAWQDGSFAHPYNTVTKGHFAAQPGDTLLIGPGNYPETPTLRTPVTVDILRLGGIVTIGR